jgi:hypothetical protein
MMASPLLKNWNPRQREAALALLDKRTAELETDEELRAMVDAMIELAGATPDRLTRRVALMSAIVMSAV